MNVCGRHLRGGHNESQSPYGPQILLLQVAGPSGGRTGFLGERHHGKYGFVVHSKVQQERSNKGTFSFTAPLFAEHLAEV